MRIHLMAALCASLAIAAPATVTAQSRIVLSNDDGLTTNVLALYHALKESGHDVIVSVPCTNQSGMGAALKIGHPLAPLTEGCLNDAAKPGDPGAGPMTRSGMPEGDFFYVNGTPIMALMYGLDVVGKARWESGPDLVLSGPNEGQNVGAINISSGTVGNAQFAALRGIPAMALSAGANSEAETLNNPISEQVAARSVELISALERTAEGDALLPRGLALNVNFPDEPAGADYRISRIGTYNAYRINFVADMAADASPVMRAMAARANSEIPALPGVTLAFNTDKPTEEQTNDESVVFRTHIAVSPMQAGYSYSFADEGGESLLHDLLGELVEDSSVAAQ